MQPLKSGCSTLCFITYSSPAWRKKNQTGLDSEHSLQRKMRMILTMIELVSPSSPCIEAANYWPAMTIKNQRKDKESALSYSDLLLNKIPLVQPWTWWHIPICPILSFHSSYKALVLPFFKIHLRSVLVHPSSRSSTQATGKLCTVCLRRFLTLVIPRTLSASSCRVYPVFNKIASRSKRCSTKSSGRGSAPPRWSWDWRRSYSSMVEL